MKGCFFEKKSTFSFKIYYMQANYLLYTHSVLRYFVLIAALIVVIQSLAGFLGKKQFKDGNKRMALILLILCDVQLLLGLALYFMKGWFGVLTSGGNVMKDPYSRFFAVEHAFSMIVGIVLVHIGYSMSKKNIDADRKFKRLFWCVFVALACFMAMIPWAGKQVVGRPNIPSLQAGS
jgi:uncharacterized membrane protein